MAVDSDATTEDEAAISDVSITAGNEEEKAGAWISRRGRRTFESPVLTHHKAKERCTSGNGRKIKFSDSPSPRRRKADATQTRGKRSLSESSESPIPRPSKNVRKSSPERNVESEGEEEAQLPEYLLQRRSDWEAGNGCQDAIKAVATRTDEDRKISVEKPKFTKLKPCGPYADRGAIPAPIAQWLRDYQVEGACFLHNLFNHQTGGILGDDMGLGKTVQVIAFLTAAFGKSGLDHDAARMRTMRRQRAASWYPRILIVCPGTLIENWKEELDRWGWWHVDVYHGDSKADALSAASQGRLEIMITTYSTFRMNMSLINMVPWDCVVADECHVLKNRRSETTRALNTVNALCRIGLTGTAIQNSYDELWTLLNWANPGQFGPLTTWQQSITLPLKLGQSHDATVAQLSMARKTARALVQNLLPRFFLRRLKSLIADQLPKKSDRVVFCPLTPTQADAYMNLVNGEVIQCIRDSAIECRCGSKQLAGKCCQKRIPGTGDRWQWHVFPAMIQLQKLSNHLATLIPQSMDPKDKQDKDLNGLQTATPNLWRQLYDTRDSILNYANPEFCGKWKIMKRLLQFWHSNGDKVLVFSHSVRLLRMLQLLFRHTSYNVSYLDGSMKYEDRAIAVTDFNKSPDQFVFLISTKAGGIGLNITSANKVVVVDPHWNPSYDLQAQDRAYRIGQVRDVEVFRLISAGTIEEIVYARQIYKQQQANIGYTASHERRYFKGVHETPNQKGELFGLKNLFTFQEERLVLRDIVHNTNVAESKAGVLIADMDSDEPIAPDPDKPLSRKAALSELAESIITGFPHPKRESPRVDPIQAILAGAGVEYSHENSEVIGSSNVETSLSRQAQAAAIGSNKHVFAPSTPHKERVHEPKWRYRPPLDVMQRQMAQMAQMNGYEDIVKFALLVESWTQSQRRDCLDEYYASRRRCTDISEKDTGTDIWEL